MMDNKDGLAIKPLKLTKKSKIVIAVVVVFIAVFVSSITYVSTHQTTVYSKIVFSFMPKSLTFEDTEYFVELVDDLENDRIKENPMLAFHFYYFDKDGNRVDMDEIPIIYEGDSERNLVIVFLLNSLLDGNIPNINVISVVIKVIVAVAVCIALVVIWFVVWSKNEDKEQERRKKSANNNKKKRK